MSRTVRGEHLRLFIIGRVVAMAKQCQVRITADVVDRTTKDTTGPWQDQVVVGIKWSGSTDALVWTGEKTPDSISPESMTADDLRLMTGTRCQIELAEADGDHNSEKGNRLLKGEAIISSLSITARQRDMGTLNLVFVGTSPLRTPKILRDAQGHPQRTQDGRIITVSD